MIEACDTSYLGRLRQEDSKIKACLSYRAKFKVSLDHLDCLRMRGKERARDAA